VYAAPVNNEESLHDLIVDVCQTTRNYLGMSELIRRSKMGRVVVCIESHGEHLSTYYKYIISAITHKLNVSGHVLIWTFFFLFLYLQLVPKICLNLSVILCTGFLK
jgi:hypothetical protein